MHSYQYKFFFGLQWELNADAAFLTLNFNTPLVVGATYIVRVSYSGFLLDPTQRGIYYDYYKNSQGETR